MSDIHVNADRSVSPILTDRDISTKVDMLIDRDDRSCEKHFSNNPPKKYQPNSSFKF